MQEYRRVEKMYKDTIDRLEDQKLHLQVTIDNRDSVIRSLDTNISSMRSKLYNNCILIRNLRQELDFNEAKLAIVQQENNTISSIMNDFSEAGVPTHLTQELYEQTNTQDTHGSFTKSLAQACSKLMGASTSTRKSLGTLNRERKRQKEVNLKTMEIIQEKEKDELIKELDPQTAEELKQLTDFHTVQQSTQTEDINREFTVSIQCTPPPKQLWNKGIQTRPPIRKEIGTQTWAFPTLGSMNFSDEERSMVSNATPMTSMKVPISRNISRRVSCFRPADTPLNDSNEIINIHDDEEGPNDLVEEVTGEIFLNNIPTPSNFLTVPGGTGANGDSGPLSSLPSRIFEDRLGRSSVSLRGLKSIIQYFDRSLKDKHGEDLLKDRMSLKMVIMKLDEFIEFNMKNLSKFDRQQLEQRKALLENVEKRMIEFAEMNTKYMQKIQQTQGISKQVAELISPSPEKPHKADKKESVDIVSKAKQKNNELISESNRILQGVLVKNNNKEIKTELTNSAIGKDLLSGIAKIYTEYAAMADKAKREKKDFPALPFSVYYYRHISMQFSHKVTVQRRYEKILSTIVRHATLPSFDLAGRFLGLTGSFDHRCFEIFIELVNYYKRSV